MEKRQKGESVWDKFGGKKSGTLWFYRTFLEIYQADNFPSVLLTELQDVVSQLETNS